MSQNIVLICLDSVRKDFFDNFAVRTKRVSDISFDNCRAASSWSAPSHASMISGLLPHEHDVTTHSRSFNSLAKEKTIFDNLPNYQTVGISGNTYAGPTYHFNRYFDEFFGLRRDIRYPEALNPYFSKYDSSGRDMFTYLLDCISHDHTFKSFFNGLTAFSSSKLDTHVLSWLFDRGAKAGLRIAQNKLAQENAPSFVFLNLMESHIPYRPARYLDSSIYDVPRGWSSAEKDVWELIQNEYDEQYWDKRNQLYRAIIDYLDQCIFEFVQSISEDTTVIVTSDHGDNLGTEVDEHLANHKSSLSEGLLHVPFYIINAPEANDQTGQYLSHLSFPKLINGIRNQYIPDLTNDRIYAELGGMSAGPDPKKDYEYYDRAIRCTYDENTKIVWDSLDNCSEYRINPKKYNWQNHIKNIDSPPMWATKRFSNDISAFKKNAIDTGEKINVSEDTAQRLKELGYL